MRTSIIAGKKLPPYVKAVSSRGHRYLYFDTGEKSAKGKPILKRLPDMADPRFGQAYAQAMGSRSRRAEILTQMSLAKMVDLFEKSPKWRTLAPSTQAGYSRAFGRMIFELGQKAPADGIERRDIVAVLDSMGESPSSANSTLVAAQALFAWGRDRGHMTGNPCADIARFDVGEYEPWPEELLALALASTEAKVQLATALLYYTAQRVGDVCALRWSDIRDGRIYLTQKKTGKEMVIRVHRGLAAILAVTPKTRLTIMTTGDSATLKMLQAFAKKHGYPRTGQPRIVSHGLRKNAVVALLESGCSIAETAAISGQTLQMVEHYAKRRNMERLGSAAILRWESYEGKEAQSA